MTTNLAWLDNMIPVVTVQNGLSEKEPQIFTGYASQTDNGGALVIFQVEPAPEGIRRKRYGHACVMASGMWEMAESEWHPVAAEIVL